MKKIFTRNALGAVLILIMFSMSGCFATTESRSVMAVPAWENPSVPGEEKVVTLLPQENLPGPTPTPYLDGPLTSTPTPYFEMPTAPTPTPFSLTDFGVQPALLNDPFSGISLQYPATWLINDPTLDQKQNSTGYTISLRAPMPERPPKQQEGRLPEGVGAIDVTIWKDGAKSYDEAVAMRLQQFRESGPSVTILQQSEIRLADGLPATRIDLDTSEGRVVEVIAFTREGLLLINAFGDLTLFDVILATVRTE